MSLTVNTHTRDARAHARGPRPSRLFGETRTSQSLRTSPTGAGHHTFWRQ
jgi:hypothetical protein